MNPAHVVVARNIRDVVERMGNYHNDIIISYSEEINIKVNIIQKNISKVIKYILSNKNIG